MDYVQPLCATLTAAAFVWVAKAWWTAEKRSLLFFQKVELVMLAVAALGVAYMYGVLQGSGAVLDTVISTVHIDTHAMSTTGDLTPAKPSRLDAVIIPRWAAFYWMVLLAEISLATRMPGPVNPDKKADAGEEPSNGNGPSATP